MKAKDLIKHLIQETPGTSQNNLGARMGFTAQAINHRLRPDDLKAGFVASALSHMGYQLVAVPQGSKLPLGSFVIDGMD